MLIVVDTNFVAQLSRRTDADDLVTLLHRNGIQPLIPEKLVEEVLQTPNEESRAKQCGVLLELLSNGVILAPLPHQIEWGVYRFLAGEPSFKPFAAFREDRVRTLLSEAYALPDQIICAIRSKLKGAAEHWDNMQKGGRENLQELLRSGIPIPSAGDWMTAMLESEFVYDSVLDALPDLEKRAQLRPRVADYLKWNPVARCYHEQVLLAHRRHGIDHEMASSPKWPKWADFEISAFVGIADRFVTDDHRLQLALDEHRYLRSPAAWELRSLESFFQEVQSANFQAGDGRVLDVWAAITHGPPN